MQINFVPRQRSSHDEVSGVSILRPRILPVSNSEESELIEYQYEFRRNGASFGGLGITGTRRSSGTSADVERTYTLDLSGRVLGSILRFKEKLGYLGGDLGFIRIVAQGLVNAFAWQEHNEEKLVYVVVTSSTSLGSVGIQASNEFPVLSDGRIVLAEVSLSSASSGE